MITDHTFRPRQTHQGTDARDRCAWLGTCERPASEHQTVRSPTKKEEACLPAEEPGTARPS